MKAHQPALSILLLLSACAVPAADPQASFVTVSSQPLNVGDAAAAARAYHDSGAYERDLATVAGQAKQWIAARAAEVRRPALVLDIDETALSNWEIIVRDDFGRPIGGPCDLALDAPCGWAAWDQLGRDPAIRPTLELFRQARALGVEVFFITGRPENQREATERNLRAAGYAGYAQLYMVPNGAHFASAADFKAPVRAQIEQQGYAIIANVGDQPSDLLGGHAERSFLLPDPFYRVKQAAALMDGFRVGNTKVSLDQTPVVLQNALLDDSVLPFATGARTYAGTATSTLTVWKGREIRGDVNVMLELNSGTAIAAVFLA